MPGVKSSKALFPFERRDKILELLRRQGQIKIGRDASRLGVSRSTLHRDLEELQRLGLAKRVRGGATVDDGGRLETHFDLRLKANSNKKQEIAKKALKTVRDDSSIFLDHSTTTLYLARQLRERRFRNLIVLTNSLPLAEELGDCKGVRVMLSGGTMEGEFRALSGQYVLDFLKRFNLHQIFASCGAVSMEQGLMTQIPFIYELLPALFQQGLEVNVLVDSSKFHKIGTFVIAPLSSRLRIFSDRELPENLRSALRRTGVQLVV